MSFVPVPVQMSLRLLVAERRREPAPFRKVQEWDVKEPSPVELELAGKQEP